MNAVLPYVIPLFVAFLLQQVVFSKKESHFNVLVVTGLTVSYLVLGVPELLLAYHVWIRMFLHYLNIFLILRITSLNPTKPDFTALVIMAVVGVICALS